MRLDVFSYVAPTVSINASTTSGRVALTAIPVSNPSGGEEVRVYNSGTVPVFIEFGTDAVIATNPSSVPIAPGTVEVFKVDSVDTHVAAVAASGTAIIYFTTGRGA